MILWSRFIPIVQRNARREVERSAVSLLLREILGYEPDLAYTAEGKPYLPNREHSHISISHTLGVVMVALSNEPIGIDVELLSHRLEGVRRILSPSDLAYIEQKPTEMQHLFYALTWTAAEALFKLVDDSKLISDFHYDWESLVHTPGVYSDYFSLDACYKPKPEMRLRVSCVIGQVYGYSVAQYDGDFALS